jgi:hypothetical protein
MQNNFKARRAAKPHQIVLVVVLVLVLETKNKADDADEKSSRPETMLGNSTANWRRHKGCKAGLFFNIPSLLLGGGRNLSALGAFSIANRGRFSCPQSVKSLHRWFVVGLTCALWMPIFARAHSPATEMAQAATNFLAALSPEQRAKATFEFTSAERVNFHFVPQPRKGLPLGELTPAQRHLASALLNAPLSHRGYFKVTTIMSLEQILFELENQAPRRNAELYYLSLFGTPGSDVWGFRFEGHHLTLNFTLRGDEVLASTPSFLGANPAEVRTGPRAGLRVLAAEEDLARQLVLSLDAPNAPRPFFPRPPRPILSPATAAKRGGSNRRGSRAMRSRNPNRKRSPRSSKNIWDAIARKWRRRIGRRSKRRAGAKFISAGRADWNPERDITIACRGKAFCSSTTTRRTTRITFTPSGAIGKTISAPTCSNSTTNKRRTRNSTIAKIHFREKPMPVCLLRPMRQIPEATPRRHLRPKLQLGIGHQRGKPACGFCRFNIHG